MERNHFEFTCNAYKLDPSNKSEIESKMYPENKIAFQYRPLVDHIQAGTAQRGGCARI